MQTETPEWNNSAYLICEKCGKKMDGKDNPAVALKDWLKTALKEKGLWGKTRVMVSGCMDICPTGKVTVGYVGDDTDAQCFVIDPKAEREELLEFIEMHAPRK